MKQYRNTQYFVTTCGRIWSGLSHKFLKQYNDGRGYMKLTLMINGEKHNMKVHKMVAECYINNSDNKPLVNHKDGIKSHNWVSNLEWSTRSENVKHAYDNNLIDRDKIAKHLLSYSNGMRKRVASIDDSSDIIEYESASDAGTKLGISGSDITSVCKGNRGMAGGYKWMYIDA